MLKDGSDSTQLLWSPTVKQLNFVKLKTMNIQYLLDALDVLQGISSEMVLGKHYNSLKFCEFLFH